MLHILIIAAIGVVLSWQNLFMFGSKFFMLPIGTAFYLYHKGRLKWKKRELFVICTALFLIAKPNTAHIIALSIWITLFTLQNRITKTPKLLNTFAEISYPLYLLHTIAYFSISAFVNNGMHLALAYAISLAFVFLVSYIAHIYPERYGILLGRRLVGKF